MSLFSTSFFTQFKKNHRCNVWGKAGSGVWIWRGEVLSYNKLSSDHLTLQKSMTKKVM